MSEPCSPAAIRWKGRSPHGRGAACAATFRQETLRKMLGTISGQARPGSVVQPRKAPDRRDKCQISPTILQICVHELSDTFDAWNVPPDAPPPALPVPAAVAPLPAVLAPPVWASLPGEVAPA